MNDDMMFEYLVQMGAMRPEELEMRRRQAQIDALRQDAGTPLEGQMVGKHYVAPNAVQALSKVGQSYLASKQQGAMDAKNQDFNARQREELEKLRRRRMGGAPNAMPPAIPMEAPHNQFLVPGNT